MTVVYEIGKMLTCDGAWKYDIGYTTNAAEIFHEIFLRFLLSYDFICSGIMREKRK